jgi:hypothetical protein
MPPTTNSPKTPGKPISFRLDEDNQRILAERAAELGVSAHELARFYVTEALRGQQGPPAVIMGLSGLLEGLVHLRADLLLAVEALLASAGKASPEEAIAWIKENYKP